MDNEDGKRKLPRAKTRSNWISEFPFLQFELKEEIMFCKICVKFEERIKTCKNCNHSFIGGCSNFRKSAIQEHSTTEMHLRASRLEEEAKSKELGEVYRQSKQTLANSAIAESMKKMGRLSEEQ